MHTSDFKETAKNKNMKIVVFVSGSGTNLQCVVDAIKIGELKEVEIACVIADRKCFALERAEKEGIKTFLFKKNNPQSLIEMDKAINQEVNLIILAGYLSILSDDFTKKWDKKIINIHPSLLPKFGGKGMYGEYVHKAVLDQKETESGATVHYVTNEIDEGEIIVQKSFKVDEEDTVKDLQNKVSKIEHIILIEAIQQIKNKFK